MAAVGRGRFRKQLRHEGDAIRASCQPEGAGRFPSRPPPGICQSGAEQWAYVYTADDERLVALRHGQTRAYWTVRDFAGHVLTRDERYPQATRGPRGPESVCPGGTPSTRIFCDNFETGDTLGWSTTRQGSDRRVTDYIWRGDRLLASRDPNEDEVRHFGLDHLGTIRVVWDGVTGDLVARHTYFPFGREATSAFQDSEPMKFTGHERDLQVTESNAGDDLDYLHARFRSPLTGRFLSVDPVLQIKRAMKLPQLWNRYSYALGNPLVYVDPTGAVVNLASMSDDERKALMDQLSAATGLMLGYDAESGTLQILGQVTSASGEAVGSATARGDLTAAVEAEKTYYGIARNDSDSVNMGRNRGLHVELDFSDIAKIDTGKNAPATFNAGMIFMHELKHAQGLRDPDRRMIDRVRGLKGDTVNHMNRIRRELGLPLRGQYAEETDSKGRNYIPFTNGPVYIPGDVE